MARPLDQAKINALASILLKLDASYSHGVTVAQVMDVIKADPDDYPMSASWVQKYIYSDECAAQGIVRSANQKQPFKFYFNPSLAASYNTKQEIMSETGVAEGLADHLLAIREAIERLEQRDSSAGTNAKMPKHQYYAYKYFSNSDEAEVLKLMELPKPSELGVTKEQWLACVGSLLRQGKAKIGGKRKSD